MAWFVEHGGMILIGFVGMVLFNQFVNGGGKP